MKKGEDGNVLMRYEETKTGRKKVFICTYQNCTCWFRLKADLIQHQKREHRK